MAARLRAFSPNTNVFSVDLPDGNTARWRELHEGIVTVSISGPSMPSIPAEAIKAMSATEVYDALLPDAPLPEALVKLDLRQQEMAPVYAALSGAREMFPEFQHAPDWNPSAELADPVSEVLIALDGEFGQIGSALDAQSCFATAGGCGAIAAGANWNVSRKNLTVASSSASRKIERSDQSTVVGIGCGQVGQVSYKVEYYDWWWSGWETWVDVSLPVSGGTFTYFGEWRLTLDGGAEDFDVRITMYDFNVSDKGSHCAFGYNDG